MGTEWKRTLPPQVWGEFEGKILINGKKRNYWIQDVTEDLYEEVIGHMISGFLLDEPLCRYTNLIQDEESKVEIKGLYKEIIRHNLALVCFTKDEDGNRQIAGMNVTALSKRNEPDLEVFAKKWKVVFGIVSYVTKGKDVFKEYNFDYYLTAMGLYVLPKYRGEGLGLEILKTREKLCKAVGIPATCTVFTSIASQTLAKRAGFQEFFEITYEDIAKVNKDWFIPNIQEHTKSCKFMVQIFQ